MTRQEINAIGNFATITAGIDCVIYRARIDTEAETSITHRRVFVSVKNKRALEVRRINLQITKRAYTNVDRYATIKFSSFPNSSRILCDSKFKQILF